MYSAVLGLEVRTEEGVLRFHDPETGRNIWTLTESNEAWQRAELARQRERQARQQAEAARDAAEAQVAELRALLARRHDPAGGS